MDRRLGAAPYSGSHSHPGRFPAGAIQPAGEGTPLNPRGVGCGDTAAPTCRTPTPSHHRVNAVDNGLSSARTRHPTGSISRLSASQGRAAARYARRFHCEGGLQRPLTDTALARRDRSDVGLRFAAIGGREIESEQDADRVVERHACELERPLYLVEAELLVQADGRLVASVGEIEKLRCALPAGLIDSGANEGPADTATVGSPAPRPHR
jgi:hypothetical protein